MKWQDKMDAIVKDVLGGQYSCAVTADTHFSIYENDKWVASSTSENYLEYHWREELFQALQVLCKERIQKSLSKH